MQVPLIFFFSFPLTLLNIFPLLRVIGLLFFIYFSLYYYSLVPFTQRLEYLFTYRMVTGTKLGELRVPLIIIISLTLLNIFSLIYLLLFFLYFTLFLAYYSHGLDYYSRSLC